MKKILSLVIALCMLFTTVSVFATEVTETTEIIIDSNSTDVAYGTIKTTGTWTSVEYADAYGGSLKELGWAAAGSMTFYPKVKAGWYKISTYNACKTHGGAGTWEINNGLNESGTKRSFSGSVNTAQTRNQLYDGWYTLATVYLSGVYEQDKVVFTSNKSGRFSVDALRIEAVTPDFSNFIMDEVEYAYGGDKQFGSAKTAGTWTDTVSETAYNGKYYKTTEYNNETITFSPIFAEAGYYNVYMYKKYTANGTLQWTATSGTATSSGTINQSDAADADGWVKLTTFYFKGENDTVVMTPKSGTNIVDALKFEKTILQTDEVLIDNSNMNETLGEIETTGTWTTVTDSSRYGGSALKTTEENATLTVYPKVSEGMYDVWIYGAFTTTGQMNWTISNGSTATRGAKVPTSGVHNTGAPQRFKLSQNENGWYKMSTVYLSGVYKTDAITFKRTHNSPQFDAIKIVKSDYDASNFVLTEDVNAAT
ncbi:MAG: hypothetical protein IKV86_00260, partial [Clostridia bacterium]|nr:hypothetical protein [Clostridia bacterium]